MFVSSPDKQMEWSDQGVEGSFRVIRKLIRLKERASKKGDAKQDSKINSTIKKVTENIQSFEYPKAIIPIIDCIDSFSQDISRKNYEIILKLMHPFCPHITEELWEKIGNKPFLSLAKWPVADERKINVKFEQAEQAMEKIMGDVMNILRIMKDKGKEVNSIYLYSLPREVESYDAEEIARRTGKAVQVFSVADKDKHDPEGKSKKAKPGKPASYVE